jgi:hypothetical protein
MNGKGFGSSNGGLIDVISYNVPGGTEENNKILQSW